MHNITQNGIHNMHPKQRMAMLDLLNIPFHSLSLYNDPRDVKDLASLIRYRCKEKVDLPLKDATKIAESWFRLQRNLSPVDWEVDVITDYNEFMKRAKCEYELKRDYEMRSNNICLLGKPIDFFYNEKEMEKVNTEKLIAVIERREINDVEFLTPEFCPYADGKFQYTVVQYDPDDYCRRHHRFIYYTLIIFYSEENNYAIFQGEGI